MSDIRGEIMDKVLKPRRRQVWLVPDVAVRMDDPNRKEKGDRPVLIACTKEICKSGLYVHVVPLSASARPDAFNIPLDGRFEKYSETYPFKTSSHALVLQYQRIDASHLKEMIATLDDDLYHEIILTVGAKVVGVVVLNTEIP